MRLFISFSCLLIFIQCNKPITDLPVTDPSELVYPGYNGIWKLSQFTDEYTVIIEDTGMVKGKARFDFTYYCQRPINRLASRHAHCEEAGTAYLISDQSYSYNDNFELVQIQEISDNQTTYTHIVRDEDNKFTGVERYSSDDTLSRPEILFNQQGQIICVLNEFIRYDYYWKRDNLVRRDVYIKGRDTGVVIPDNFYVILPLCLNKSRIDLKRYREIKLLQARKISTSSAGGRDWIKVETEVYTYFDHLFPFSSLSSGWPSTYTTYDLCTPVNDIKSWVTYLVDENGKQTDEKTFELYFTLLTQSGNLPTSESYIQKSSFFDLEAGLTKKYEIHGIQKYTYQSGCSSILPTSSN